MLRSLAGALCLLLAAGLAAPAAGHTLLPNHPDPFCPETGPTTIEFALDEACQVRLEVNDLLGQPARLLVYGLLSAGMHSVVWDGTTDAGDTLRSVGGMIVLETWNPDEILHEGYTAFCGDGLDGPFRRLVAGRDTALGFGIGLEYAGPATLVILAAEDETVVRTLVDAALANGVHNIIWDLRDDGGQRVPAGDYRCRLTAGRFEDEVAFALDPTAMASLAWELRDADGVLHTISQDPAAPTVIETPMGESWLHFGRSLSEAEFAAFWEFTRAEGCLSHLGPGEPLDAAPDLSWVHFGPFEAGNPWPDYYGWGGVLADSTWFEPHAAFVHLRHDLHGVTWLDENCDSLGIVDSEDWNCASRDSAAGPPIHYDLLPCCPNPVLPEGLTQIRFTLPATTAVTLVVIDDQGEVARTLRDEEVLPAGYHTILWDLTDDLGAALPEGFYRVICDIGGDGGLDFLCGGDVWITSDPDPTAAPQTPAFGAEPVKVTSWPNPAHRGAGVRVAYRLPEGMTVALAVFDIAGRRVRALEAIGPRAAGWHGATWDGRDEAGRAVAAGVYFARLESAGRAWSRRLVLLR